MKPADLLTLLQDGYRDKLLLRLVHEAGARRVADYDHNNTYQYVIAREDVHLSWLRAAIEEMGGELPLVDAPELHAADTPAVLQGDVDRLAAFAEKWRPAIERVTNARHRGMLRVVFGESLEQKRFFEQALAGRRDLLGRSADGARTPGAVGPVRWLE